MSVRTGLEMFATASDFFAQFQIERLVRNGRDHFMGSLNRVILIGRLGKDPNDRMTGGGTRVSNFSLATDQFRSG